jgi:hypothetical protein
MPNPSYNVTLISVDRTDDKPDTFATNATGKGGVSLFMRWSLASQHRKSGGFFHRSNFKLPGWLFPFEGRSIGGCSCRAPGVVLARWHAPSCRYITGACFRAILVPFATILIFNDLYRRMQAIVCILEAKGKNSSKKRSGCGFLVHFLHGQRWHFGQ